MELKVIFSCIILCFYITSISAYACTKPNERYCIEENCCESACTYQGSLDYQLNKSQCICNNNFARNKNGDCIEPKECIKFCPTNEEIDKNAVKKNAPCSIFCKCKPDYYRFKKECVKCSFSTEQKSRCDIFDAKTCSCSKCKNEFKLCKGNCFNNHKNCRTYDLKDNCRCLNCEIGFKYVEGVCVQDVPFCTKFDQKGKCITCEKGKTICKNTCLNDCTNGKILDSSSCLCKCPPKTQLCGSKCFPECESPLQLFCPKTCKCVCKKESFPCGKSCHPYVNNCVSYKNDTCKCEYCKPGFKLCNEKCVPFKCKANETFINSICKCDCEEGCFRNEKGVCTSTEKNIELSVFYKLFLEIIFSFLPSGNGFCRENEFYSSWPLKYEETCKLPRIPDPTEKCFCKSGFIRDDRTHTCVKVCPLPGNPCSTNEVYECGPERYCKIQPAVRIEAFVKAKDIEGEFAAAGLIKDKALLVEEPEAVDNQNKAKSQSFTEEKALVDAEAKVDKVASVDVEVLKEVQKTFVEKEIQEKSKDMEKPRLKEPTTKEPPTKKTSTQEPTTIRPSTQEPTTIRPSTQEPPTESPVTEKPTTQTFETTTENPKFIPSNEEFCGYHCKEGFGRVGSVCKKCMRVIL